MFTNMPKIVNTMQMLHVVIFNLSFILCFLGEKKQTQKKNKQINVFFKSHYLFIHKTKI